MPYIQRNCLKLKIEIDRRNVSLMFPIFYIFLMTSRISLRTQCTYVSIFSKLNFERIVIKTNLKKKPKIKSPLSCITFFDNSDNASWFTRCNVVSAIRNGALITLVPRVSFGRPIGLCHTESGRLSAIISFVFLFFFIAIEISNKSFWRFEITRNSGLLPFSDRNSGSEKTAYKAHVRLVRQKKRIKKGRNDVEN